ncbi:hypothetical protein U9M48_003165 [Paspalum notatum var. saurae]|uniref:Uncharacterized protein n=1 Tax=Paspalum notatum var. saurae TaxID=547442 RepID=A0AAQ3PSE0_PASNO
MKNRIGSSSQRELIEYLVGKQLGRAAAQHVAAVVPKHQQALLGYFLEHAVFAVQSKSMMWFPAYKDVRTSTQRYKVQAELKREVSPLGNCTNTLWASGVEFSVWRCCCWRLAVGQAGTRLLALPASADVAKREASNLGQRRRPSGCGSLLSVGATMDREAAAVRRKRAPWGKLLRVGTMTPWGTAALGWRDTTAGGLLGGGSAQV